MHSAQRAGSVRRIIQEDHRVLHHQQENTEMKRINLALARQCFLDLRISFTAVSGSSSTHSTVVACVCLSVTHAIRSQKLRQELQQTTNSSCEKDAQPTLLGDPFLMIILSFQSGQSDCLISSIIVKGHLCELLLFQFYLSQILSFLYCLFLRMQFSVFIDSIQLTHQPRIKCSTLFGKTVQNFALCNMCPLFGYFLLIKC